MEKPKPLVVMNPGILGLAGFVVNAGLLLMNFGFTSYHEIEALDRNVFSFFGQICILLWGLCFWAVGYALSHDTKNPKTAMIWCLFTLEKVAYVLAWLYWHSQNSGWTALNDALKSEDSPLTKTVAAIFINIYGIPDAIFAVLFFNQAIISFSYQTSESHKQG
mmetsp:Transcript_34327/g.71477  ORF Transcript_34327/g.71477 Transcript_34327/m.71477 type:complete len:163 (-) Transcript_34327:220-708(-)